MQNILKISTSVITYPAVKRVFFNKILSMKKRYVTFFIYGILNAKNLKKVTSNHLSWCKIAF